MLFKLFSESDLKLCQDTGQSLNAGECCDFFACFCLACQCLQVMQCGLGRDAAWSRHHWTVKVTLTLSCSLSGFGEEEIFAWGAHIAALLTSCAWWSTLFMRVRVNGKRACSRAWQVLEKSRTVVKG